MGPVRYCSKLWLASSRGLPLRKASRWSSQVCLCLLAALPAFWCCLCLPWPTSACPFLASLQHTWPKILKTQKPPNEKPLEGASLPHAVPCNVDMPVPYNDDMLYPTMMTCLGCLQASWKPPAGFRPTCTSSCSRPSSRTRLWPGSWLSGVSRPRCMWRTSTSCRMCGSSCWTCKPCPLAAASR